jgi:dipeptidase E
MKLLLTSAGITNQKIAEALFDLVGKKPEETSLVVIPTAMNVEVGDKDWFITDLVQLQSLGLYSIDIVDISALDESAWKPRIEAADVLFFAGGNTYHLMRWLNRSGLAKIIPDLLKEKVYVGVSAGSMVASKDLALHLSQVLFEDDLAESEELAGLSLVDFYVLPHFNSEYFKKLTRANIEAEASKQSFHGYALDNASALKIVDGKVEVVSEGEWFVIGG